MGIFTKRPLEDLNFMMYLYSFQKDIRDGNYDSLRELAEGFNGVLPSGRGPLRIYSNYCAFRSCANESFGSIEETLDVFRSAIDGDDGARSKTENFFDSLFYAVELATA